MNEITDTNNDQTISHDDEFDAALREIGADPANFSEVSLNEFGPRRDIGPRF